MVQLEYLRREYGGRVEATFLPLRVDTDFYTPGPAPAGAAPYLFSIGNDGSRDFDTLTRAMALLDGRAVVLPRCRIHTARPVAPTPNIDVSRGAVTYPELRDLYRGARLVVVPLRDAIHPGGVSSILEAMAAGRPLIVSGSRGIADYVADGETGVVVPPGDATALAAAIQRLLASPAEAERLGQAAREFAVATCQNQVCARALAEILREVVWGRERVSAGTPVTTTTC
jgi:glycosyltransferase involved in cell wall biosynthesis